MTQVALSTPLSASGPARLDGLLRRFATPAGRLARRSATLPDDPRARLDALLQEIDEIMLPRRIELRIDGKTLAHLSAYSRRLASVEIVARPGSRPTGETIASDFADRLLEIAATPGTLTCRSARHQNRPRANDSTCSVGALKAALGFDVQRSEIVRLTEIMTPIAIAKLDWVGDPGQGQFSGEGAWRQMLEQHALIFLGRAGRKTFNRQAGAGRAEGIAIPLSAETIIVLARLSDRGLAAILPYEAGLKAIAFWQAAG
ncbi:MAG: hypothetical protein GW798_02515 [Roseovarius sp.]|nr:hypothetical protein [Roseovarius sp.]